MSKQRGCVRTEGLEDRVLDGTGRTMKGDDPRLHSAEWSDDRRSQFGLQAKRPVPSRWVLEVFLDQGMTRMESRTIRDQITMTRLSSWHICASHSAGSMRVVLNRRPTRKASGQPTRNTGASAIGSPYLLALRGARQQRCYRQWNEKTAESSPGL